MLRALPFQRLFYPYMFHSLGACGKVLRLVLSFHVLRRCVIGIYSRFLPSLPIKNPSAKASMGITCCVSILVMRARCAVSEEQF